MKRSSFYKLTVAAVVPSLLMGCARCDQAMKGCASEIHGLNREVRLYSFDGKELGRWHTTSTIDYDVNHAAFLDSLGRRVHIAGGIIIDVEK